MTRWFEDIHDGDVFPLGEHHFTEPAAGEHVLRGPDRLIEAHVVVDREHNPGVGAPLHEVLRIFHRERQRLLREDSAEAPLTLLDGSAAR